MNSWERMLQYFCQQERGWLLLLVFAVCIAYLPFLGSPFFFDDLPFFLTGTAERYAHAGFDFELRWFPYAIQGWLYGYAGDALTHLYHLLNVLLHGLNTILLFFWLRQLAGAVLVERQDKQAITRGAGLAALLFALHPVAAYAAGYVVELSILMATSFALLLQVFYLRGLLTGRKRWLFLSVLAYFLGCFSKEHSVLMPGVLLALTILLRSKIVVARPALWFTWGVFVAVGLLVAFVQKGVFGTPYEAMASNLFEQQGVAQGSTATLHLLSVLTQAGLYFKYLWLWLLPNPAWMAVDMREPFISSVGDWRGWLGAVSFLTYGFVSIRLLLKGGVKGLIGFALCYPWLQFWLEFSSIRVQEPFVLYRSYLWMPGLFLLIPLLMLRWPGRGTLSALGLISLLLVPLTVNRLWVFADNYRLWDDAARLLPNEYVAGADRIFFNRAQASVVAHDWETAIVDFQRAVVISPDLAPVRNELGMALLNAGRYEDAKEQFDTAIGLKPNDGQGYYGKGLALMGLRDSWQATQQMEKACKLGAQLACIMQRWRKK